ncbi:MAG: hypothetical protein II992_09115 [Lachnospiraceae bacterium]|nr:hypothetical protein [Lachnospiraceae bacterium]
MVQEKKVEMMTKLAIFEKNEKDKAMKLTKYYLTDYVRGELLKSFFCVTIGYLIIGVILSLYNLEYLISHATSLNYPELIGKIVMGYIVLQGVYLIIGMIGYQRRFHKAKRKVKNYDRELNELRLWYRREKL